MSDLYENLKKLEKLNNTDSQELSFIPSKDTQKNKRLPYLLSIIAILIILTLSGITLYFYPHILSLVTINRNTIAKIPQPNINKVETNNSQNLNTPNQFVTSQSNTSNENTQSQQNQETKNTSTKELEDNTQKLQQDIQNIKVASEQKSEQQSSTKELQELPKPDTTTTTTEKTTEAHLNKQEVLPLEKNTVVAKSQVMIPVEVIDLEEEIKIKKKKLLEQAESLRKKDDLRGAAEIYEKIWMEFKDTNAANNLGATLIMLGNYQKAIEIFEEAIKLNPNDEDLIYNYNQLKEKKESVN